MKIKAIKDILPHFDFSSKSKEENLIQHQSANLFLKDPDSLDFFVLIQNWETIVGEKMALVSRPVKNMYKELTIATAHPVFSHHLSFLQNDILDKIKKHFPQFRQIKKLKFINKDKKYFENKEAWDQLIEKKREKEQKVLKELHPHSPQMRLLKSEAKKLWESEKQEERLPPGPDLKTAKELESLFEKIYIQFKSQEQTSETI
jgi:hypothetical protein